MGRRHSCRAAQLQPQRGQQLPRNGQGRDSNSQYVNLRPGLNIGPWRLRNYSTWSRSSQQGGSTSNKWDTVYTYLQRDIQALGGQLLLGDSTSPSDVFDGVPFRGGQLASDDEMLPESLRGYAPSIRGSPGAMPRSPSARTATPFIRPTSLPAALKSAICTRPVPAVICR